MYENHALAYVRQKADFISLVFWVNFGDTWMMPGPKKVSVASECSVKCRSKKVILIWASTYTYDKSVIENEMKSNFMFG